MSDGRLRLESKKSMRGRLGKSPDHGDALALDLAGRRPMSVPGVILLYAYGVPRRPSRLGPRKVTNPYASVEPPDAMREN